MLSNIIEAVPSVIHQLIDIYWSDIYNKQVIEKTHEAALQHEVLPESLNKYFQMMKDYQISKGTSPFLIIEPYGEALEKLEPAYFSIQRANFYQEG
ncbi:hypothetical protein [Mesobacillus zeae]|uniref:hypothetical protein n=1 Tax=Mesobacillus zeae TaxID=1917180 RepID=UPI00300B2BC5